MISDNQSDRSSRSRKAIMRFLPGKPSILLNCCHTLHVSRGHASIPTNSAPTHVHHLFMWFGLGNSLPFFERCGRQSQKPCNVRVVRPAGTRVLQELRRYSHAKRARRSWYHERPATLVRLPDAGRSRSIHVEQTPTRIGQ